jgi:hypothetical protein
MANALGKSCLRTSWAGVALLALGISPAFAGSPQTGSGLRVLARYDIPQGSTPEREVSWTSKDGEKRIKVPKGVAPAFDIRWASDDSVYVARADDGVFELALEPGLKSRRQLVPNTRTLGRFAGYEHLAASSSHLVFASSGWYLAWRPLDTKEPAAPSGSIVGR